MANLHTPIGVYHKQRQHVIIRVSFTIICVRVVFTDLGVTHFRPLVDQTG
ncbi:hypothetical protein [Vibrio vulnificus YJ016]|uniref:Uncharacterized protein n=1 Tax=Vibrio vulnificus (strain YJ016) TaxID=196600 RepID=Q7MNL8_VIBVY|nr:hypothetical protein [Vibrio vulnificus YJ016]